MLEILLQTPKAAVAPSASSLLMHYDGTNGSTTMTDVHGHSATAFGTAALNTSTSKFGGSSLWLGGAGLNTRVQVVDALDLQFDGDFTIEMFLNVVGLTYNYVLMEKSVTARSYIEVFNTEVRLSLANIVVNFGTGQFPAANTWFHYAITRQGTKLNSWTNGVKKGESTGSTAAWGANTGPLVIGNTFNAAVNAPVYIDELRLTKGAALYTDTFTPPASPFTS